MKGLEHLKLRLKLSFLACEALYLLVLSPFPKLLSYGDNSPLMHLEHGAAGAFMLQSYPASTFLHHDANKHQHDDALCLKVDGRSTLHGAEEARLTSRSNQ